MSRPIYFSKIFYYPFYWSLKACFNSLFLNLLVWFCFRIENSSLWNPDYFDVFLHIMTLFSLSLSVQSIIHFQKKITIFAYLELGIFSECIIMWISVWSEKNSTNIINNNEQNCIETMNLFYKKSTKNYAN